MRLLFGFSVVATLLALVGIYGLLSLSVGSASRDRGAQGDWHAPAKYCDRFSGKADG
jgi:hypothetical protein